MAGIHFKIISTTSSAYKQVFDLRETVLRQPIGLSLHDEDLSNEVNDHIFAAMQNEFVVGCLILSPRAQHMVQLRQMAVAPELQGQQIGKQLVQYAEQFAWQNGYEHIMLHARMEAKGFYDKLGYKQAGDEFTEVGIPHIEMIKDKP